MKISEVLAISGKPGLFKVLASSAKNLVVESMLDGKRTSVPGSIRVSSLNDITMYTLKDDVPLQEILLKMHKKSKGAAVLSHNSTPQEIKDFVDSVITNLDHDRVYSSDLRKLVQWYNILIDQNSITLILLMLVKTVKKKMRQKTRAQRQRRSLQPRKST